MYTYHWLFYWRIWFLTDVLHFIIMKCAQLEALLVTSLYAWPGEGYRCRSWRVATRWCVASCNWGCYSSKPVLMRASTLFNETPFPSTANTVSIQLTGVAFSRLDLWFTILLNFMLYTELIPYSMQLCNKYCSYWGDILHYFKFLLLWSVFWWFLTYNFHIFILFMEQYKWQWHVHMYWRFTSVVEVSGGNFPSCDTQLALSGIGIPSNCTRK